VNSKTRVRNSGATRTIATIFSAIGVVLGAAALIVAFVIDPPVLGWVGFGIVSVIVLGLGGLAPLAFERTRVSPQRPAVPADRDQRLLVIADSHGSETALCDAIFARLPSSLPD
jgi:hypothetical protein